MVEGRRFMITLWVMANFETGNKSCKSVSRFSKPWFLCVDVRWKTHLQVQVIKNHKSSSKRCINAVCLKLLSDCF